MMKNKTNPSVTPKPLRLWPGVVIVVLQWLARFVVPVFVPQALEFGVLGALACGFAFLIWWAFFSRAPWSERWGALGLMVVALVLTSRLVHESIATGMVGMTLYVYAIPVMCLAFIFWATISPRLAKGLRWATMLASILLSCGVWTLVRTGGFSSDLDQDFAWRWAETPEERLLAAAENAPVPPSADPNAAGSTESVSPWPGFRGRRRDSILRGVQIDSDWSESPPVELWRRPIGPGWSSFAAYSDLLYTQEQRGDKEVVACYALSTGAPVWRHGDPARFWESNAGAGPRATPSLHNGRVFTLGASGILHTLNAHDGTVLWSRNVATDTNKEIPGWGFASSPLVVGDLVVVAVEGQLAAYDIASGDPRWFGPDGGDGYSSPHHLILDDVEQILLASKPGIISVAPADGTLLWEHPWPGGGRIVQPALTADGDLLISRGEISGMRRIAVMQDANGWTVQERWTSKRLKPYFSDFVIHNGHAYGFDGRVLACIDVAEGQRQWKGGRYGSGQLLLFADQDLLLVLSEKGVLALVQATPTHFKELSRFPAIKGKTWNHPVLVGDTLLVRNAQEMAAFRLAL